MLTVQQPILKTFVGSNRSRNAFSVVKKRENEHLGFISWFVFAAFLSLVNCYSERESGSSPKVMGFSLYQNCYSEGQNNSVETTVAAYPDGSYRLESPSPTGTRESSFPRSSNQESNLSPKSSSPMTCKYRFRSTDKSIKQVRLDMIQFFILPGNRIDTGDCLEDSLTFHGGDWESSNAPLGPLCGDLAGQHMYLNFKNDTSTDPNEIIAIINYTPISSGSPVSHQWNILVNAITENSPLKAPQGCLQYFQETRGTVMSFNYNLGQQLNCQDYTVCILKAQGMNRITWDSAGDPNAFIVTGQPAIIAPPNSNYTNITSPDSGDDLCTTDWIQIGGTKYCGNAFSKKETTDSPGGYFTLLVHFNEYEFVEPTGKKQLSKEQTQEPENDLGNSGFSLVFKQLA